MLTTLVTVKNALGMHARPCSTIVKAASKFRCDFEIKNDEMTVNGKSIMGVMMLAAECGSQLELIFDGVDEADAMNTIVDLFESGFGDN